jgi:putative redox protein
LSEPSLEAELTWVGGLRFRSRSGHNQVVLDGDGQAAASPVQALAFALCACMASDLVHILERQRQELRSLTASFAGWRAAQDPRRFVRIDLRFRLEGRLEADKVERAVVLSREKYCSVLHSLRPDIDFTVAFELSSPPATA